jgi:hypothetical protein
VSNRQGEGTKLTGGVEAVEEEWSRGGGNLIPSTARALLSRDGGISHQGFPCVIRVPALRRAVRDGEGSSSRGYDASRDGGGE